MRLVHRMSLGLVCLGFTGADVAWADAAHPATIDWVESPFAPHKTVGPVARLGTAVGFLYNERIDVTAVGLSAGIGHRFGRFAIGSEYTYLQFQERGPSDTRLGDGHRASVLGRFDVLRLGSTVVGGNSMLAIYVEGGAGVAWNTWFKPGPGEGARIVPADSKRIEAQGGFGIEIDHRLQEPIGFPKRIGWSLGWRVAAAPHDAEPAAICRSSGVTCAAAPMMPADRYIDRSMLFQSTFGMTW
ncbi:MAG: hypothetical protein ACKV2T_01555 [Kofleriaceae bacterium]